MTPPLATGHPLLVVLASSRERFNAWCYDSGLSPHDPEVLYASTPEDLRGLADVKFIRTRHWRRNRHATRLDEAAQIIEHRRQQLWDSAAQASHSSTRSPAPSSRPAPPTS